MPEATGAGARAVDAAPNVEEALHVLDLMVDAVTLDSTAVGERAARVIAEHLGDTLSCTAYGRRRAGRRVRRAPRSRLGGRGIDPRPDRRTSTRLVRRG